MNHCQILWWFIFFTSNLETVVPSNQTINNEDDSIGTPLALNTIPVPVPFEVKQQYMRIPNSTAFQAYAASQGIDAKVYVTPNTMPGTNTFSSYGKPDDHQDTHCPDYNTCLHSISEASIQANIALDNKGDTLTQLQMFKMPMIATISSRHRFLRSADSNPSRCFNTTKFRICQLRLTYWAPFGAIVINGALMEPYSNTNQEFALTVHSNCMGGTTGRHTLLLLLGQLSVSFFSIPLSWISNQGRWTTLKLFREQS